MKFVKLSLVAALAAGSFSALNAKPLEEAIKNVDVSGFARYRYDSGTWKDKSLNLNAGANGVNTIQNHRFRAAVGTTIDVGDGFKVVGQLMYNNDSNFAYAYTANQQSAGVQGTNTKSSPVLKLAYLQYANADFGYSAKLGRQQLNTIWTEDLTGMAAEAFYSPVDGFTLAAFAVDSIEGSGSSGQNGTYQVGDTDATNFQAYGLSGRETARLYKYNLYGAALIADVKDAGIKAQAWGAYWQNTANLWAVKLDFQAPVAENLNYVLNATYLGNTVDGDFNSYIGNLAKNGALYDLRGGFKPEGDGFDAKLGGIMFGKKDGFTINTLEGQSGAGLGIGREIFYQKGSWFSLAFGQSTYGYVGAGYTFNGVRLGVQGVYGGTKSEAGTGAATAAARGTGTKMELVGELGWKVNKNLDFLVWYSNLSTKAKQTNADDAKSVKDSVRFQAYYKF